MSVHLRSSQSSLGKDRELIQQVSGDGSEISGQAFYALLVLWEKPREEGGDGRESSLVTSPSLLGVCVQGTMSKQRQPSSIPLRGSVPWKDLFLAWFREVLFCDSAIFAIVSRNRCDFGHNGDLRFGVSDTASVLW